MELFGPDRVSKLSNGAPKGLRLLSLDGGGVRGLSSLLILESLMEQVDPENPPKPYQCFDMIGGTSTGGLIAIMLGRLEMSAEECIEEYKKLIPAVFTKGRHRVGLRGKFQGRFSHEALEDGVKKLLERKGMSTEELLKNPKASCKSFVCATSKQTRQSVILSDYYSARRGRAMLNTTKIWQAARATSAATSFFEPIEFNDEGFVDGATGANNPLSHLWTEAAEVWRRDDTSHLENDIAYIVSIGTGLSSTKNFKDDPLGILSTLADIATDNERVVDEFTRHHPQIRDRFFRFNVGGGLGDIGLEDKDKLKEIIASTRHYCQMDEPFQKLIACGKLLKTPPWNQRLAEMINNASLSRIKLRPSSDPEVVSWVANTNVFDDWTTPPSGQRAIVSEAAPSIPLCYLLKDSLQNVPAIVSQSLPALLRQRCPTINTVTYIHCALGPSQERYTRVDAVVNLVAQNLLQHRDNVPLGSPLNFLQKSISALTSSSMEVLKEIWASKFGADPRKTLTDTDKLEQAFKTNVIDSARESETDVINVLGEHKIVNLILDSLCGQHETGHLFIIENLDDLRRSDRHSLANIFAEVVKRRNEADIPSKIFLTMGANASKDFSGRFRFIDEATESRECMLSLEVYERWDRFNQIHPPQKATTEWAWSHPAYRQWQKNGCILWICGKPGSGKSVLAKEFVQRLESSVSGSEIVLSSWFYNRRGGQTGISHKFMLQSVLADILSQRPASFMEFRQLYRQERLKPGFRTRKEWAVDVLQEALRKICLASRIDFEVVLVIDAVDESEEGGSDRKSHHDILQFFSDLATGKTASRLRVMILSRPSKTIQDELDGYWRILMESENSHDIQMIINAGMSKLKGDLLGDTPDEVQPKRPLLPQRKRAKKITTNDHRVREYWDDEFREMQDYLVANADGVILWVSLILTQLGRALEKGTDPHRLKAVLKMLPTDLLALYEHIIISIDTEALPRTRKILTWLLGTIRWRRLTIGELFSALCIPDSSIDISALRSSTRDPFLPYRPLVRNDWFDFTIHILDWCGTLVEVVAPSGKSRVDTESDLGALDSEWTVQLLHKTVVDFLREPGKKVEEYLGLNFHEADHIVELELIRYISAYLPLDPTPYIPQQIISCYRGPVPEPNKVIEYLNDLHLVNLFLTFVDRLPEHYAEVIPYKDILAGRRTPPQSWFLWPSHSHLPVAEGSIESTTAEYLRLACEEGLSTTVNILITLLSTHRTTERVSVMVPALFLASQYGFSGWVDSLVDHAIDYIGEQTGTSVFEIMKEAQKKRYSNIITYLGRARLGRLREEASPNSLDIYLEGEAIRRTAAGEVIEYCSEPPLWWLKSSFLDFPPIPNSYEDWKAGRADEAASARNKCIERLILWLAQKTQQNI